MQDDSPAFPRFIENLIARAERFFRTDLRYLITGGFWLTATKIIALSASFVTSIAFANWLDPDTYGVYRYVLSLLPLLTLPTLAGIDTALTRSVAQGKTGTIYPALELKQRWSLWGVAATLCVSAYYYMQGDMRLAVCFLIAAASIPFMEPYNLYVAVLNGLKDFKRQTYYGAIVRAIPSLLIIATIFFTANIFILMAVYFLSYTMTRYVLWQFSTRSISKNGTIDLSALGYGKHLSLMNVLGVISTSLDKVLIFHFGGSVVLAGYYLALVPYKQISSGFASLSTLALPKLSLRNGDDLKRTLPHKVWKSYFVIVPTTLAYIIFAPFFFGFLYPKYLAYVYLSDFFALQLLFFPISIMYTAITARGETFKLYISTASYAVVRIALILVLTPLYGMWGAAWAIMLTGIMNNSLTVYQFYRLR